MDRALLAPVLSDLERKMVFLAGPRQVGKTTLAKTVLSLRAPHDPVYLNWDRTEHRKIVRDLSWSRTDPVAVLDEVHKYPRWKTLLKGFHDTEGARQRLLVTGSARMDLWRRGGDSLTGRFAGFRLHPLSLGEIARRGRPPDPEVLDRPEAWADARPTGSGVVLDLLRLGGFPEPFLGGSDRQARRWRLARHDEILRQDLRDLSRVREAALVEQLADLLPERVGAPLSINALREILEVDFKTARSWIEILERLFLSYRVRPYAGSLARTLRKEAKAYLWDWAGVPAPGPRFENLVGSHLLKYADWMREVEGVDIELRYVRDREGREVDFLLLRERRPWVLVEARVAKEGPDRSFSYFRERMGVPIAYVVTKESAGRILAALP